MKKQFTCINYFPSTLNQLLKTAVKSLIIYLFLGHSISYSQNEIVTENALTGTPSTVWDISGAGDLSIQGFSTDISVDQGETVYFKINTDANAYTIDIYRLGYYQGNGARLQGTGVITATLPQTQPADSYETATGLTDCGNWAVSANWDVPSNAVSGIYIAKLTRTDTQGASHIVFIVRDDDGNSDLLFKTSDATWQAYNNYGGNSLYVNGSGTQVPGFNHATKVSYNRPFYSRNGGGGGGAMEDWVFNAEYPMIRFLERNGYDVSYTTDLDMDRDPTEITPTGSGGRYVHKVLLSVGHDEYWSAAERTKFEVARDSGVHLAFFSGNEVYWKTRWENNNRTLVCYKEGTLGENVCGGNCDLTTTWTGLWRDGCDPGTEATDACNPENALTGQISWDGTTQSIVVPYEYKDLRLWRNTSIPALTSGTSVTFPYGTLGYEWDWEQYRDFYPPGRITLSESTYGSHTHKLSLYRHSSGALVFGAGTCQWSWGLDGIHDRGSLSPDTDMQQATINLFADMDVQPGTIQTGLTIATASTDVTPPVSIITSPSHGASFSANSTVTINGTASEVDGVLVGVDISVDGGLTWKPASGSTNWSFSWTPLTEGTVTILTHAFDDSGNMEISGTAPADNAIEVTITAPIAPICPCSIWDPLTTNPVNIAEADPNPYELGVKFRSTENGYITGIRFYKSTSNTGTHIGNLWSSSGSNLAQATFINETASGWQEVTFGSPVQISAGTTYVASYHTSAGYYSEDDDYFTTGVDTYYLQALANDADGPNGVYASSAGSAFPTNGYQSSNYYVDVVFVTDIGPDITPPVVVSVSPTNGSSGIAILTQPKAYFNEILEASTVNASSVLMTGPGTTPVAGTANYLAGTITFTPDSPLEYSTTYTLTLKGGYAPRIEDLAGNRLSSDYVWSFTTSAPPPPPPTEGPGGPILVISAASNPFSRYPVEILRAQGFNEFFAMDVSEVTSTELNDYEVIILGELPLQAGMVTDLTTWVNAGGILIALRPDLQLSGLLGITSAGGTLSDKYLLVNTSSGPGVGIVDETIQFHSEADYYTLNGATSIATLYADATTSTSYPAVTENIVGPNGGKAYTFTYDLARSIVYTRQGNPDWADQKRDGAIDPIRSDDLFYGDATFDPQPDWIDLNKVAIPQADEQQHLLSNIITLGNLHHKPLPRFWFLPKGLKAAVVMTGDNHGDGGMQPRFDIDIANSPVGCSVADWECVRSTGYLYVGSTFTDALAQYYNNLGFEVAIHVNTGCAAYTDTQFDNFIDAQFTVFNSTFPSIPLPQTNRNHCIAWSGYAMPAEVEAANNIRLDVNYYYWPNDWMQNLPGMFTGSGLPMRFAKTDGTIIDCYQVVTQMQDEGHYPPVTPYPAFCDALLDKAIGSEGYYGVFATNMHFDNANHAGANAIVASAQSRGIPVVSSKQMLDWLDGRNGSSFESITWNIDELSFTITVGAGALNLRGMLPVNADNGVLVGLTKNSTPIVYTTESIKGVEYAFFEATDGDYIANYGTDNVGPVVTNIVATPSANGTATITWTTSEPADSQVDYDTSADPLTVSESDVNLVTEHTITLTGLLPNTTYYYRVTSVDAFSNSTTTPNPPADALQFATPAGICAQDQTATDFSLGTTDANTLVVQEDDGGVMLKPLLNEEFSGTVIPSNWTDAEWETGGISTFDGNQVTVNGAHLSYGTVFNPGTSLEFVATFTAGDYQNVGFTADAVFSSPWIVIGRGNSGDNNIYARTSDNETASLGSSLLNAPHKYRIQWLTPSNTFEFYVDDVLISTPGITQDVSTGMIVQISDYPVASPSLTVDWIRISPYAASGSYTSRIINQGSPNGWGEITWNASEPSGSNLSIFVRTGNTASPDGSWTGFSQVTNGLTIGGSHQYIQYRADFTTTENSVTSTLKDLSISCGAGADITPPVISNVLATPGQDGVSAIVSWDTDEIANSLVEYGTESNNLSQSIVDVSFTLSHSLELTGLTSETTYYYRVTSTDASANPASDPVSPGTYSFFTPIASMNCFTDQTVTDFELGTTTDTYISIVDDGELILKPAAAAEFTVLPPTSEWESFQWISGNGSSIVSGGSLIADGTRFNTEPPSLTFGPGDNLEFVAVFSATPYQHIGYGAGTDAVTTVGVFNSFPWAMFGTGVNGTALLARVAPTGGPSIDYAIPGSYLNTSHLYRIEWLATGFNFYIDGSLVHYEPTVITDPMRVAIADYNAGGSVISVDWIHATPFNTSGTFESRIYDAGSPRLWGIASWTADIPANTTLQLSQRQSNSNVTILSEPWSTISSNGATIGGTSQYIQYKADFTTSDTKVTAVLKDIVFTCSETGNIAPVIAIDPVSQLVCEGETVSFISSATGNPLPTVQWQDSPDGTNWTDIAGATNDTLTFVTEAIDDGLQFQAVWTNSEGSATSNAATLSVNPKPTATIAAINNNLCQGNDIQLQLTATTGSSPFDLEVNGTLYSGISQGEIFAAFAPPEYTIWEISAIPTNPSVTDGNPIELGVKFQSDVNGLIKGIRFYCGGNNSGNYTGSLWTTGGTLLATATFTSVTTNDWQEVRFNEPVYIAANTTYIASYYSSSGYFALTAGGLTSAVVNPPLTALASGTEGPNGVYRYGAGGGFPNNGNTANYFVDVVFEEALIAPEINTYTLNSVTDANSCFNTTENSINVTVNPPPTGTISGPLSECPNSPIFLTFNASTGSGPYDLEINGTPYTGIVSGTPFNSGVIATPGSGDLTIWPESAVGGSQVVDEAPTELGIIFSSTEAGVISGIRFYKTETDVLTFTGSLWEIGNTSTPLATANYTTDNTIGWKQINFSTPVPIEANTNYMASYFSPNPNNYAFTGDGMSAPVVNAPLTAISSWYAQPGPGYPITSSTANYWVDVVFSYGDDYEFSLTSISDANGCSTNEYTGNTINVSVAKCGEFQAFLQGNYDSTNNTMNVGLTGNIPLSQPYNVTPWFYDGTESLSVIDPSVVDWVLIELRSDTETAFERKAALLLEDGSIVQYNNITQGVHFENTVDGNSYYVVVYHRNHMPVMSANTMVLENNPVPFSFSELANCYGGGAILLETTPTTYGLIAGDINSNGMLSYSGPGNDRGLVIARIVEQEPEADINTVTYGYFDEDVSMDYNVKYIGSNNDRAIIPTNLAALTGLNSLNATYQSVVPGFTTKSSGLNDGPVHIYLEESASDLEVKIITNENIYNGIVDNVQFTLSWNVEANGIVTSILKNAQSSFGLLPQGDAMEFEGKMYQVYVSVLAVELPNPFSTNDKVNLINFHKDQKTSLGNSIEIADNYYTSDINGSYYISLMGKDFTGNINTNVLGIADLFESGLTIYPNPVTAGLVHLDMKLSKAQKVSVQVLDIQGKIVHTEVIHVNKGISNNHIELHNLPNGIYYLKVQAEKLNAIRKLIVL